MTVRRGPDRAPVPASSPADCQAVSAGYLLGNPSLQRPGGHGLRAQQDGPASGGNAGLGRRRPKPCSPSSTTSSGASRTGTSARSAPVTPSPPPPWSTRPTSSWPTRPAPGSRAGRTSWRSRPRRCGGSSWRYARRVKTEKRGGHWHRLDFDAGTFRSRNGPRRWWRSTPRWSGSAELNPRLSRVVECRFFGGMTEEEVAAALGVTERTVRRDWIKAKGWLMRELKGADAP